ncbi:MAG: ZTL protein [Acidobacteriota bacterium]|nr:ZTL protein [Acidobacteriota bacterium]
MSPDEPPVVPTLFVLAGVNGAGKSSIGGAWIHDTGAFYFNPDEAARAIRSEIGCSIEEANAQAWQEGKDRIESAIRRRESFAFESTLGANTIPRLLGEAVKSGFEVVVWFVGLSSVEQHIARVRSRVAAGGHDIPEAKIRERWDGSRRNIISLMPYLTELRVYDNSRNRDPITGEIPSPQLILRCVRGLIVSLAELEEVPEWAKPILARAVQLHRMKR